MTTKTAALLLLLSWTPLGLRSAIIETVAGGGSPINQNAIGTTPGQLNGLASYGGEWYFTAQDRHVILKRDAGGVLRLVAGQWDENGFSGDGGPASTARLQYPTDIVFDASGNLYFSDRGNNRIRRVDASTGIITTYAGGGGLSSEGALATMSYLNRPEGLAISPGGDLYVAVRNENKVRRINASNQLIYSIAGDGTNCCTGLVEGGQATAGYLRYPRGLALNGNDLYIGEQGRIRKVNLATGTQVTVAGTGGQGSTGDYGPALSAQVDWPGWMAFDNSNNWL